jgi:hypothetical protein
MQHVPSMSMFLPSCTSSFSDKSKTQLTSQQVEVERRHCLLIIGFRVECGEDGTEKTWFLIQNSWPSMPLLEVSAAYLGKHVELGSTAEATYAFFQSPLAAFPDGTHPMRGLVVESYFEDGGDDERTKELPLEGSRL